MSVCTKFSLVIHSIACIVQEWEEIRENCPALSITIKISTSCSNWCFWLLFGKGNIDGLAMFWDTTEICMKLSKSEWKVNQQEGEEEFKCYMIWEIMLHSNRQLRTERDGDTEEGCQNPAVEQKTTDDWLVSKHLRNVESLNSFVTSLLNYTVEL